MAHEIPPDHLSGSQPARPKVQPPSLAFSAIWGLIFVFGGLFAVRLWFQDAVPAQRINSAYLPAECAVRYDSDDPSKAVIRRLSSYRQNDTGVVVA